VTVHVPHHPLSPPITPFDALTALIMNLFDHPNTSDGCISRQGVREDHSDPVSTINLTKWLMAASYTDENEEISLVTNFNFKKNMPPAYKSAIPWKKPRF
jgi:hypothetical protein